MESSIWGVFAGSLSFSKQIISSWALLIKPTRSYQFLHSKSLVQLEPLLRVGAPSLCWLLKWKNNQSKTLKHSTKPNRFPTSCSENISKRKSLKRFLGRLPFKPVLHFYISFAPSASVLYNFILSSSFRKI